VADHHDHDGIVRLGRASERAKFGFDVGLGRIRAEQRFDLGVGLGVFKKLVVILGPAA